MPGGRVCPTLISGEPARYDQLHFTASFSRTIVPTILERAERAGVRFSHRARVGSLPGA